MKIFGQKVIIINNLPVYTCKLNFADDLEIKEILEKHGVQWFKNKTKKGVMVGVELSTIDFKEFELFTYNLAKARREIELMKINRKYHYLPELTQRKEPIELELID